ncbi:MAG: sulfotransferase [Planctomycetes bacterium]|nr:sulfotransferase [Planctomycetota bacterium]
MNLPPVFLRPIGRSGGTLFVTMLDAHPELAMSYEIYEDRLIDTKGTPMEAGAIVNELKNVRPADGNQDAWIRALADRNLQVFIWRACRAGLDVQQVLEQVSLFNDAKKKLDTLDGRLELIEMLMVYKMQLLGKKIWGGKAAVDPRALHKRNPHAKFFIMIRDGRDILASRLNTGKFDTDPTAVAKEWVGMLSDFRDFALATGVHATEISYEELVYQPEQVLTKVCEIIGVEYSPKMLSFHEQDMSLFRNPYGHLSHKQIAKGLNANTIGRWKRDLTAKQVDEFCLVAGYLLDDLGYMSHNLQVLPENANT